MPVTLMGPVFYRAATRESMYRGVVIRSLFAVLACAVLAGCGGGAGSSVPPPTGHIAVTVASISFPLGVGSNYQFAATVTGSTNTAVNWQVNGIAGGNATVGTIDSTGLYIAPGTVPSQSILVTAVAQADGVSNGSTPVTLSSTDPIGTGAGTAASNAITCPSGSGITIGGTCYSVSLSCPGIADLNGYLWVNMPTGTPVGTVLLTGGANSEGLYADPNIYTQGADVVNGLLAANYITVQTSFGGLFTTAQPFGWQTGPGGLRRVACRYVTLAKWVQQNIAPASKPVCATGNSAGAGLIGYAMAHYGGDSIFTMVEPTSGPPFSRLDYSCECNQPALPNPCASGTLTQCVGSKNAQDYIDPAYAPATICSDAVGNHSTANGAQFLSDSILSPEATLSYSNTFVHFAFGGQDTSSAPVMGNEWREAIIPADPLPACVPDGPHDLADVVDGAAQIVSDIVASCR
jgi:hypothetical protein